MNRRVFLTMAGGAGCAALNGQVPAGGSRPMIIELRQLFLRNTQDAMVQRTNDFLSKTVLPALQRVGVQPAGAFTNLIGESSPYVLLVSQYATLAAWEDASRKMAEDTEYQKGRELYFAGPLQYTRMEVSLLRASKAVPRIEVPAAREGSSTRIFEIRTYESNNSKTLARKIRMFDEGEIDLFRKIGMHPVFFGETIAGRNMPNLCYMLAYDDLAAREKAWATFVSHPEWKKMSSQPGVSDAEVVSNISNSIVRPLPFSQIK